MKLISGNASYIVNVSSRYIVNVSLIVHVNNEEELIVTRYKCWGLVVRATRSLSKRGTENLGSHLGGPPQARLRSSATDPNIIAPT